MKKIILMVLVVVGIYYHDKKMVESYFNQIYEYIGKYKYNNINSEVEQTDSIEKSLKNVVVAKVYLLGKGDELTFNVLPYEGYIKVTTEANWNMPLSKTLIEQELFYEYSCCILDAKGNILNFQEQKCRSKILIYEQNNELITTKFYLEESWIPSTSNNAYFPLNIPNYRTITLKLDKLDAGIENVSVRVYFEQVNPEQKITYLWNRLPEEKKKSISEDNLYPHHLLHFSEKYNLLRKEWKPMAPIGVPNRDYQVKSLYIKDDIVGTLIKKDVLPEGDLLDIDTYKVIEIPREGAELVLQFLSLPQNKKEPIKINWYGKGLDEEFHEEIFWEEAKAEYRKYFAGGIVEIISPHSCLLQGEMIHQDKALKLFDLKKYLRVFHSATLPVRHRVFHEKEQQTPFRLDFRYFSHEKVIPQNTYVSCSFYDKNQELLENTIIPIKVELFSNYDFIWEEQHKFYVSEVFSQYFRIPNNVSFIEIESSQENILVNAYNRPASLLKYTKVPEDYYVQLSNEIEQPSWFRIFPTNYKLLFEKQQSKLLHIQTRPPEKNEYMLNQHLYSWEIYKPENDWRGKYIMIEDDDVALKKENIAFYYHEIIPNVKTGINFVADYFAQQVQPTILYKNTTQKKFTVEVYLNNELAIASKGLGPLGEIKLPYTDVDTRNIEIKAPQDVQFYLNYVEENRNVVRKQMIFRLQDTLVFRYRKQLPKENISLRVYSQSATNKRCKFKVAINVADTSVASSEAWSFTERVFDVKVNLQEYYTFHSSKLFYGGELCVIPLNEDVSLAEYQVTITLIDGDENYISMATLNTTAEKERTIHLYQKSESD